MRARYPLLQFALVTILLAYGFIGGLADSGLRNPAYLLMTLLFLAGIMVAWLLMRRIQRWAWYPSPLDAGWLLLTAAIGITWLANLEASRRIIIGVAYVGICIGLWYVLWDGLSSRRLRVSVLIDGLLVASLTTVGVSLVQIWQVLTSGDWRRILDTARIVGLLDNPNIAGGLLTLIIPLAAARWVSVRSHVGRLSLGGYLFVLLILLFASGSRGAWVSAGVGLVVAVTIGLITRRSAGRQNPWLKIAMGAGSAAFLLLVLFIGGLASARTGSDELRGGVFRTALQLAAEKPLTGYGLWTFGRELPRFESIPPGQALPFAHNFILNTAAELGLIGLIGLGVALVMLARSMAHSIGSDGPDRDLVLRKGAVVALVVVGVHHLFDQPLSASPLLAVLAVLVAAMAAAPPQAGSGQRFSVIPLVIGASCLLLIGVGFWHQGVYRQYFSALQLAVQQKTAEAINLIDSAIAADPAMPMYAMAKGYLLGAADTDASQLREAISALEQLTRQEPYYAPGWMNLSALYVRVGEQDRALRAAQQAAIYAPKGWQVQYWLGQVAETSGEAGLAATAYRAALDLYPDLLITAEWDKSAVRQRFAINDFPVTRAARAIDLLTRGQKAEASETWAGADATDRQSPAGMLIDIRFSLDRGDVQAATDRLANLAALPHIGETRFWVRLGEIGLMHARGDEAGAAAALGQLRREVYAVRPDDRLDAITYSQYRVIGTGITFLPDIFTLPVSPSLMRMVGE